MLSQDGDDGGAASAADAVAVEPRLGAALRRSSSAGSRRRSRAPASAAPSSAAATWADGARLAELLTSEDERAQLCGPTASKQAAGKRKKAQKTAGPHARREGRAPRQRARAPRACAASSAAPTSRPVAAARPAAEAVRALFVEAADAPPRELSLGALRAGLAATGEPLRALVDDDSAWDTVARALAAADDDPRPPRSRARAQLRARVRRARTKGARAASARSRTRRARAGARGGERARAGGAAGARLADLRAKLDALLRRVAAARADMIALERYERILAAAISKGGDAALAQQSGFDMLQMLVDGDEPRPQCAICCDAPSAAGPDDEIPATRCVHPFCRSCLSAHANFHAMRATRPRSRARCAARRSARATLSGARAPSPPCPHPVARASLKCPRLLSPPSFAVAQRPSADQGSHRGRRGRRRGAAIDGRGCALGAAWFPAATAADVAAARCPRAARAGRRRTRSSSRSRAGS